MTDTLASPPAQPGLQSLSKSFEPAAIEARWGPEWEQRGYGQAGHRGSHAAALPKSARKNRAAGFSGVSEADAGIRDSLAGVLCPTTGFPVNCRGRFQVPGPILDYHDPKRLKPKIVLKDVFGQLHCE